MRVRSATRVRRLATGIDPRFALEMNTYGWNINENMSNGVDVGHQLCLGFKNVLFYHEILKKICNFYGDKKTHKVIIVDRYIPRLPRLVLQSPRMFQKPTLRLENPMDWRLKKGENPWENTSSQHTKSYGKWIIYEWITYFLMVIFHNCVEFSKGKFGISKKTMLR